MKDLLSKQLRITQCFFFLWDPPLRLYNAGMVSFYKFNAMKVEDSIKSIRHVFSSRFPNFCLAYSLKTNSYPGILSKARDMGVMAEVVSPEEFLNALDAGFCTRDIVYNGVCKSRDQVAMTIGAGGLVNIDNGRDLEMVLEIAGSTGLIPKVGVRLNFDVGNKIRSRFGVKADGPLYSRILSLDSQGKISVIGLSCHFTSTREDFYWRRKAHVLSEKARNFRNVEYLDFGGSLAGSWERSDGRNGIRGSVGWDDVACSIYEVLHKEGLDEKRIMLECGTAVCGSSFDLVTEVLHIKDEERIAVIDAGFSDMYLGAMKDTLQFEVIHHGNAIPQRRLENYSICGSTCLENDIVKKGFNGNLAQGDRIVFRNVGAYSFCFSNGFIRNPLKVVAI